MPQQQSSLLFCATAQKAAIKRTTSRVTTCNYLQQSHVLRQQHQLNRSHVLLTASIRTDIAPPTLSTSLPCTICPVFLHCPLSTPLCKQTQVACYCQPPITTTTAAFTLQCAISVACWGCNSTGVVLLFVMPSPDHFTTTPQFQRTRMHPGYAVITALMHYLFVCQCSMPC